MVNNEYRSKDTLPLAAMFGEVRSNSLKSATTPLPEATTPPDQLLGLLQSPPLELSVQTIPITALMFAVIPAG